MYIEEEMRCDKLFVDMKKCNNCGNGKTCDSNRCKGWCIDHTPVYDGLAGCNIGSSSVIHIKYKIRGDKYEKNYINYYCMLSYCCFGSVLVAVRSAYGWKLYCFKQ